MSGTLRRDCFWMTIIKSNPGDEFYCEGPDTDKNYFNCDNCKWFITKSDMQDISLHIVDLFRGFWKAEPVKHGRWKWNKQYGTECSECGTAMFEVIGHIFSSATPKYCPYCGARMDEVEE